MSKLTGSKPDDPVAGYPDKPLPKLRLDLKKTKSLYSSRVVRVDVMTSQ